MTKSKDFLINKSAKKFANGVQYFLERFGTKVKVHRVEFEMVFEGTRSVHVCTNCYG